MLKAASENRLLIAAAIAAGLLIAPIAAVLLSAFTPAKTSIGTLFGTVMPRYLANTAVLAVLVGSGTLVIGTATAWLVTMCRFPGRRVFEWALVMPLAIPAYVVAYAYTDFLQHPGPVQTLLRDVTGWGPRDYWFPNIRTLEGAALMLVLVLYPYVYLLARSAFLQISPSYFDVARTLGRTSWQTFWTVSLPLARPAIVVGVTLTLMETVADFGTVAHFGVQTFTTGIYRSWFSMGDRIGAAQLAAGLLAIVFLFLTLERWQRGEQRYVSAGRHEDSRLFHLRSWRAAGATLACAVPILLGFILPVAILLRLNFGNTHNIFSQRYFVLLENTLLLGGVAAIVATAMAVLIAYAARLAPGNRMEAVKRVATLGYAVPGSVIAVGLLIPLTALDNAFASWWRSMTGHSPGLILTGSAIALVFAYVTRFMAAALGAVDASLGKITPNMDHAARTLGQTVGGTLRRVHLPLIRTGLLTAILIVLVDVMKELPATLIMRPFNLDTLAVQAYRLASDERLADAATPALLIVAAGLLPVIVLSRQIANMQPGSRRRTTVAIDYTAGTPG